MNLKLLPSLLSVGSSVVKITVSVTLVPKSASDSVLSGGRQTDACLS